MMLIGITGYSGSGKSTLANLISNEYQNSKVLHIDEVGHEVLRLTEVIEEIKKSFGEEIVREGFVNRKLLGDIVFNSRHEMDKLTKITWNAMQVIIDKEIDENKGILILDWLLLPHTKYFNMCDLKIMVDVPFEERMRRAIARDGISEEKFRLRDSASIDLSEFTYDVIVNDVLKEDVRKLVKVYE